MYISVIPLRHSLSKRPYIYFAPEVWHDVLDLGYLVEIPLGKHIVPGIVAKVDTRPENVAPEDIKSIIRVIASVELIAPYMISMIEKIADHYFLPIHKVASMFLPAPLLTRLDKKNYLLDAPENQNLPSGKKNLEIHHYIDTIFQKEDLIRYMKPGTVFVFPDDIMLRLFSSEVSEPLGFIPNDLTPARRVGSWIESYERKQSIIFGTRRILYYNLSRYENIIYIEDALGTEQYTYPIKIQNLDILQSLEQSGAHAITIISSSPSLMTLSYFRQARLTTIRK